MHNDNHGSQSGDNSLNVGVGDFRGANVNINHNERPTFTPEQLDIQRHPALGGRSVDSKKVSVFGYITGAASLLGLYFSVFQGPPRLQSSWPTFFMFAFIVAVASVAVSAALRRRRFDHFLGSRHYLEISKTGRIYVNRLTANCPWCGSGMHLRRVGPKGGPHDDGVWGATEQKVHLSSDPLVSRPTHKLTRPDFSRSRRRFQVRNISYSTFRNDLQHT